MTYVVQFTEEDKVRSLDGALSGNVIPFDFNTRVKLRSSNGEITENHASTLIFDFGIIGDTELINMYKRTIQIIVSGKNTPEMFERQNALQSEILMRMTDR